MSLAPREQWALARIEHSLARSDPRLATMLATFTLPFAGRVMVRAWRLVRFRRVALVVMTLAVVGLLIAAWAAFVPVHAGSCPTSPGRFTTPLSVNTCQSGGIHAHPSHIGF
jgi:hypothetical protein